MKAIKKKLFQACNKAINLRIQHAQEALDLAQESANDETKSSAGDKHETGRAMAQLETEKATKQLTEALKMKASMDRIDSNNSSDKVVIGSLVICNTGRFLICVSAGKIKVDGTDYFAISSGSPIGGLLMGKTMGEDVTFNKITHAIQHIA